MGDRVEVDPDLAARVARELGGTASDLRAVLAQLNGIEGEIGAAGAAARGAMGHVSTARGLMTTTARELDALDIEVRKRARLLVDTQQVALEVLGKPNQNGSGAEVFLPGLGIGLLRALTGQQLDGNLVRMLDQEAAIAARIAAGQAWNDAVAQTLGLSDPNAGGAMPGRAPEPGQPTVLFVGGIRTNDDDRSGTAPATHTWAYHEADLTQREDLAHVGYYTFNWGSTAQLPDSLLYPSTTVPVTTAADRVESQLKLLAQDGATNVVMAGHSKGGALVMEYLCEVAEGRRQMVTDQNGRPLVVAASAMDSPLGGGPSSALDAAMMPGTDKFLADFVGFERYRDGHDRLQAAADKLKGRVDIRIYDNPDDVVSSPGPAALTRTQTYTADRGQSIERIHGQVLRDVDTRNDFWQFVEQHAPAAR